MYIFYLLLYNIIRVNSSKYIKLMPTINYINILNYLYRVLQFDMVSYLHVPGILAKNNSCVSINCNCSNSMLAKTS